MNKLCQTVALACFTMTISLTCLAQQSLFALAQEDESEISWLRGTGAKLEMRFHGTVIDKDGIEVDEPHVHAYLRTDQRRVAISPKIIGSTFEFWVPVNDASSYYLTIEAANKDGSQVASILIGNHEFRVSAIDGVNIQLRTPVRSVLIRVRDDGEPVASATVALSTSSFHRIQRTTDEEGECAISLPMDMNVTAITAWTDDNRLGEVDYSRTPPYSSDSALHEVSVEKCHTKEIVVLNADRETVPGVRCVIASMDIRHMDFGVYESNEEGVFEFPYCLDELFLPYLITVVDKNWEEFTISTIDFGSGRVKVTLHDQRTLRISGNVILDDQGVPGSPVNCVPDNTLGTHVFSDAQGRFDAVIPRSHRYGLFVDDENLLSKPIRVGADEDSRDLECPPLCAFRSERVEITMTRGDNGEPIVNQRISAEANFAISGGERSLFGAPSMHWHRWVVTNEEGKATLYAAPGKITLNTDIGRRQIVREIDVKEGERNEFRIETDSPDFPEEGFARWPLNLD